MGAAEYNLNLEKGSAFQKMIHWRQAGGTLRMRTADKHLRMSLRSRYGGTALVSASTADLTIEHLGNNQVFSKRFNLLDAFTIYGLGYGYPEIATDDGDFTPFLSAEDLAAIAQNVAVWDLEMVPIALMDTQTMVDAAAGFPSATGSALSGVNIVYGAPLLTFTPVYTGADLHALNDVDIGDIIRVSNATNSDNNGDFVIADVGDSFITVISNTGAGAMPDSTVKIELIAKRIEHSLRVHTVGGDIDVDNGSGKAEIVLSALGNGSDPWDRKVPLSWLDPYNGHLVDPWRRKFPVSQIINYGGLGSYDFDVDAGGVLGHVDSGVGNTDFATLQRGDYVKVYNAVEGNDGIYLIKEVGGGGRWIEFIRNWVLPTTYIRGIDKAGDTGVLFIIGQPEFRAGDWVAIEGSSEGNSGFYQVESAVGDTLTLTGTLPGADETFGFTNPVVFQRVCEHLAKRLAGGRCTIAPEATV